MNRLLSWELEEFATLLFYEDILGEQEILDEQTGAKYQLYFAQEILKEDEPASYLNRLYVIDEALSPVKLLEWENQYEYTMEEILENILSN